MPPTPPTPEMDNPQQGSIRASEEGLGNADEQTNAIAKQIQVVADNLNTYKEQQNTDDSKERTLNKVTIFLVFLTAAFTGGSWWEFKGQLDEMRKASEQTA